MAHKLRLDSDGAEFHVMNRGSARRTIFDTRADHRYFLAQLARAVRRGEILVLAYTLMRTHYHLYVRSLGRLSQAIRRIQLQHARRFNRTHRRDGPLFRGRFKSKEVDDDAYRYNLIRYIDENPVLARISRRPEAYEWGSAWRFAQGGLPRWLSPEVALRRRSEAGGCAVGDEAEMIARREFIEARLDGKRTDEVLTLDHETPTRVLEWMRRKAQLADGVSSLPPSSGPLTILAAVDGTVGREEKTRVPDGRQQSTRDLLLAGLLRYLARCAYSQVARTIPSTESRARRLCAQHLRCVQESSPYAELCKQAIAASVAPLVLP